VVQLFVFSGSFEPYCLEPTYANTRREIATIAGPEHGNIEGEDSKAGNFSSSVEI